MFTDILCRFLLLETFVLGALCRVCVNEHPQKQFCISDFVFEVKLDKELGMNIKKVLKGNIEELSLPYNRYMNKDLVKYFNFKAGKKYYFFARNQNGILYIDTCNGIISWEKATLFHRRAMTNRYEIGCECIEEIGTYSPDKRCQWLFSHMDKFGKHCKWVDNFSFNSCQKSERRSGK